MPYLLRLVLPAGIAVAASLFAQAPGAGPQTKSGSPGNAAQKRGSTPDAAKPEPVPVAPAAPAATPSNAPVQLSSQAAIRGQHMFATIVNAPPGEATAQVMIGGAAVPATVDASGKAEFTIPADVALGSHPVKIVFAKFSFPAGPLKVVRELGALTDNSLRVKLDSVEPDYVRTSDNYVSLTARGRNFVTDPQSDNQLLLGRVPREVVWDDKCKSIASAQADKSQIHATAVSAEELHFCNVPIPDAAEVGIAIRQGVDISEQRLITIRNWSKAGLMLWSAVLAGLAVALVLGLVHAMKHAYKIKDKTYVLRALYLDPETDTYSLSKAQFYAWTIAALFAYAFFFLSRILAQKSFIIPDVPGSLPGIIAIGAGTAIGSQFLTNIRGPKGAGQELPTLGDFVTSGGVVAPERVQMVVWTFFGVIAFLIATILRDPTTIDGLPSVPQGLLYLSGISSLGYLGGKLARKPGPVISEISLTPSQPDSAIAGTTAGPAPQVEVGAPLAAARQALVDLNARAAQITALTAPQAVTPMKQAVAAVNDAVNAVGTIDSAGAGGAAAQKLSVLRATAESAASVSASEFDRMMSANPREIGADVAGKAAEIAQKAAAILQDLAASVTQSVAIATLPSQAPAEISADATGFFRQIDLRGRNLAPDATFDINDGELPFRMLMDKHPVTVAAEDDSGSGMWRELRLRIAPASLGADDRKRYDEWFANPKTDLNFTIVNPDGQKAVLSFSVPPAAAQSKK